MDLVAETTESLFAAIDSGERADGYEYQFEGEPLPTLSGRPLLPIGMNVGQQAIHLLSDPNIAFLLFSIGFYGILAELFHPNFFSGIVGGIAIVLAFIGSNSLPLNVGGLILIAIGLGLFALELFVASYGLLTVGGAIAFILGAFALYTGVDGTDAIQVELNPALVALPLLIAVGVVLLVARGMVEIRRKPAPTQPMLALVGAAGTRPDADLADRHRARPGRNLVGPQPGGIRSGRAKPSRVVGVEGLELIVEPAGSGSDRSTAEE